VGETQTRFGEVRPRGDRQRPEEKMVLLADPRGLDITRGLFPLLTRLYVACLGGYLSHAIVQHTATALPWS
jgi:hypothetical protein